MTETGRMLDAIQSQRIQALKPWSRRWEVLMSHLDIERANMLTAECGEYLTSGRASLLEAPLDDVGFSGPVLGQLKDILGFETVRDWCSATLQELEEHYDLRWICEVHELIQLFLAERLDSSARGNEV
tara:strand:- start:7531 stop:7914 length:384 start_codon:yes stop_codon:yes gene_type:complete